MVQERTDDNQDILSMSRCKGALNCMFLSDVVTADGRNLEHYIFNPGGRSFELRCKFPKEIPTPEDWDFRTLFWTQYTDEGGVILSPLECWQHPSHRIW